MLEQKSDNCDLCGGKEFKTLRQQRRVNHDSVVVSSSSNTPLISKLSKCSECDLVQVLPSNREADLLTAYETAIDETHSENSSLRIRSFKRAMQKVLNSNSEISSNMTPRLVDIGCAGGEFPAVAASLGFDVVAFEPSRHLSEIGREKFKLDIRSSAFDRKQFGESSIDIVTLWDVLEHVDSPRDLLTDVMWVIRPGGFLILNLPMIDTFTARVLRYQWPFYLHVHLYYFTNKTIRRFLEQFGGEIISVKSYSQTLSTKYLVRRATGGSVKNFAVNLPMRYWLGQRTVVVRINER